ncbi:MULTISPECIES: hypothetical protein [unclassified Sulfurospirillum]|uniref:hypothetical protein n=1 Tax=unclassified Sulfurospirillum TaxID=2618290 RepID=UPI00068CC73F|nr:MULTISPECIES: hypothetical protein [unclassified Sulfurospirillum]
MDDFEDTYKKAIEAGERNLRAKKLLSDWCFYAEFARSPGRGMIEESTGLPIGHMGVQCKFSKKNSMHSWLLEDSVYDFYQNNCKSCTERVPVGFPNIMDFVGPREKAAEERKKQREKQERERKQKQNIRRQERAQLRHDLSLEETFVFDLLDELDQEDIAGDDPRLEQLANLAPETFTRKVIQHLLPAVLHEHLPYSTPAIKALLRASLKQEEKLLVAVYLVTNHEKSPAAIDIVLSGVEKLSHDDLIKVLYRFVFIALGPPPGGMYYGGEDPIRLDSTPISTLIQKRRTDICTEVDVLMNDANPESIRAAVEIILATDDDELLSKHTRTIFAKLIRRRILLHGERQDSYVLHYLREVASKCFERFPEKTDEIIQSYLIGIDDTGKNEAHKTYASVLKYQYTGKVQIGTAQQIAFKRLLWAAVESPDNFENDARNFFSYSWNELSQLAVEHFDDLIGAAATLSEKYDQIDAEPAFAEPNNVLAQIERSNKRSAIDSLQEAFIEWATVGARARGPKGIEEFLELYRRLPENQTQMRGNMIAHVSKLLSGVESLTQVLSDWYGALMDENTLIRAKAAQAWEYVPYKLVKNFPNLFFEAFSVLLSDPYVIVHQSAVHSLKRRSFPEEKRNLIKGGILNMIVIYAQGNKQEEFIIDCIDTFASLCLSPEEKNGELGKLLSHILHSMEGHALYHAVNRLHYSFQNIPGFAKVALKSIQDDYTRSISIDDCASSILRAPQTELQDCISDIKNAFETLSPFRREDFIEALLYAAALSKAGDHSGTATCFRKLIASIPVEDRNEYWRIEAALVASASEIEHAIKEGESFVELIKQWRTLLSDLEKENEERAKLRDFPPSFLFEN